jgi:GNAT superfamily N-acetyltransferase
MSIASQIESCTKGDFDQILNNFGDYWDDDATRPRHHPIFVFEFSDSAFVIRDGPRIAAYLLGFVAQSAPVGYVHLVAVHRSYRRRGLARTLYDHFIELARRRGCTTLKATAAPENHRSIAFHTALGMSMEGEPTTDGIQIVKDYAGPGIDRVVFTKAI